jgi:hypothetical protein
MLGYGGLLDYGTSRMVTCGLSVTIIAQPVFFICGLY